MMRVMTSFRYVLALLFLVAVPGMAFAVQSSKKDTRDVLVRLPDQYLNANNFSVPQEGKSVVADLSGMKVVLYQDGVATMTLPILSKGRKGTPWETPSGVYQILTKEKNHFSSLGHVFMPWSMQFYGNFFIHGWPYDAEGNEVPRGYSGGCVRLSTPDAEIVFRFAERGTPVIVRAKDEKDLSGGYYVSTNTPPPDISAESLVVMDLDRGQILWKKDAELEFTDPLVSKYLSALASLEHMNQYTPRELPKGTLLDPTWLKKRSSLPAKDLIAPLMFSEGTMVEEIFAREHGRKLFVRAMEEKAKAFGMLSTEVNDLGGASTSNRTTATDMVHLLRALDQSKRYLLELTARPVASVPDEEGEEPSVLTNAFILPSSLASSRGGLMDPRFGNALFVFTTPTPGGESRSIAVAMGGSTSMDADIIALTSYLSTGVTYIHDSKENIVTERPVGFFAKIRMIWNRKRIGDMLLGREISTNRTEVITEALRTPSLSPS
jgi:hypothetical protein